MTLSLKQFFIIGAVLIVVFFGFGRYSNRQPALVQTKTEIDVKKKEDQVVDKRTTIVKEPSGKQTTVIVEKTHTVEIQVSKKESQKTIKAAAQVQAAILLGVDIKTGVRTYGAAISKQFIGPVTLGVFGLTNKTVGVSIGMTF